MAAKGDSTQWYWYWPYHGELSSTLNLVLLCTSILGLWAIVKFLIGVVWLIYSLVIPGKKLSKFGSKKGAWAVVTGCTAGIGLEFAKQLAEAGFNIFLVSRDPNKLKQVAKGLGKSYPNVKTKIHAIDLAAATENDFTALAAALETLEVGVLINNAGKGADYPEFLHLTSESESVAMININVIATVRLTHMILPGMVRRKRGLVLNMGSFSGYIPTPFLTTYAGTKGFLHTFTQALATEVASYNIVVRNVNAYFVVSNLSKIRRSSFTTPMPGPYVRTVLAHIGQSIGGGNNMPYTSTPYFAHALVQFVVDRVGTWRLWLLIARRMQNDLRDRAIRKRSREGKEVKSL